MRQNSKNPVLSSLNVPSLVTLVGVLGGFVACVGSLPAGQKAGPLLTIGGISLALLTDRVDGALARRLNQRSEFGGQLDSLSDALAFVVAPALSFASSGTGSLCYVIAAIYVLCGLCRLAAFHCVGTQVVSGKECFLGVPTPAAGATYILCMALAPIAGSWLCGYALLVLSPLLVSSIVYPKRGFHDLFCATSATIALVLAGWHR